MFTVIGTENDAGRGKFARHAVGARFLEYLHRTACFGDWAREDDIETCQGTIGGKPIQLMRQLTGKVYSWGEVLVPHLLDHINTREIIVIYDEANLGLGEFSLDVGSVGTVGHRGIKSFVRELENSNFAHGRIGIGEIPTDESEWEKFFNGELTAPEKTKIETTFPNLLGEIIDYVGTFQSQNYPAGLTEIPEAVVRGSQLPGRVKNLPTSPVAVELSSREIHRIDRAVTVLVKVIQESANRYSRLCHDLENPATNPLGSLLESGVPQEMVALIRRTQFHIDHLSFDFQQGKLVEINAAPLPPLISSRIRKALNLEGPGAEMTLELLCQRVEVLANRHRLGGREGKILLLNKIGELPLGKHGWHELVSDYLREKGYPVISGSITSANADVIWANLTWMVPDRWSSVIDGNVWERRTDIFPSPRNFLFTSKRFLVALSNPLERYGILNISRSDGNEVLDSVVPWTRVLEGETDTIRWVTGHGLKLYGKPYLASGGRGGGVIKSTSDLQRIEKPAVIQAWLPPYQLPSTEFNHDLRVVVYGPQGQHRVWMARIWEGSDTLQKPMDAPVLLSRFERKGK